jgi:hypothetical protein
MLHNIFKKPSNKKFPIEEVKVNKKVSTEVENTSKVKAPFVKEKSLKLNAVESEYKNQLLKLLEKNSKSVVRDMIKKSKSLKNVTA